jgi:hypothetical protein
LASGVSGIFGQTTVIALTAIFPGCTPSGSKIGDPGFCFSINRWNSASKPMLDAERS